MYLLCIQESGNSESQFKEYITVRAEQQAYLLIQKVVILNSETTCLAVYVWFMWYSAVTC